MAKRTVITKQGLQLLASNSQATGQYWWIGYYAPAYIPNTWKGDELDFPDAEKSEASELRELFEMAITDLNAREAAEFLLKYKLSAELNHGQIENIAHTEKNREASFING